MSKTVVLTVLNQQKEVCYLDFDHWMQTGEIVEVEGVKLPFTESLYEVSNDTSRQVIGLPREMEFRIEVRLGRDILPQVYTTPSNGQKPSR